MKMKVKLKPGSTQPAETMLSICLESAIHALNGLKRRAGFSFDLSMGGKVRDGCPAFGLFELDGWIASGPIIYCGDTDCGRWQYKGEWVIPIAILETDETRTHFEKRMRGQNGI